MNAKQFIKKKNYPSFNDEGGLGIHYVEQLMIEFAKHHVEQANELAKKSGLDTVYSRVNVR